MFRNVMHFIKIQLYQMDVLLMHLLNVKAITNVLKQMKLVKV